jgi:hypothetical protein
MLSKVIVAVAEREAGAAAGATGVFPLGLGGQPPGLAGLFGQPGAEFRGGVLGHPERRVARVVAVAHLEVHRHVGRGRLGDDVGQRFAIEDLRGIVSGDVGVAVDGAVLVARLAVFHEAAEKRPCGLGFRHPERVELDLSLRAFVGGAARFGGGGAEGELPAGQRQHLELRLAEVGE